jgi:hypothetical protein
LTNRDSHVTIRTGFVRKLIPYFKWRITLRVIIAGSRTLGFGHVETSMRISGFIPTCVLSGCAAGVDKAGEEWANQRNIPVKHFPAKWGTYGKSAGVLRNIEMSKDADALVAVWDRKSRGTGHMIDVAKSKKLKIFIYNVD